MNLVEMVESIGIEWRDYSFHFVVIVVDKIVDSIVVALVVDILENKRLVVDSVLDSTRMVVWWCYLKRNKDSRVV
jgi:hypothetical protein